MGNDEIRAERSESMTNECRNPNAASGAASLRGMGVPPVALQLARRMGGRPVRRLRVRATQRCSVVPPLGGSGSHGPHRPLPDPEPPKGGTTIRALRPSPRWGLHDARRNTPASSTLSPETFILKHRPPMVRAEYSAACPSAPGARASEPAAGRLHMAGGASSKTPSAQEAPAERKSWRQGHCGAAPDGGVLRTRNRSAEEVASRRLPEGGAKRGNSALRRPLTSARLSPLSQFSSLLIQDLQPSGTAYGMP